MAGIATNFSTARKSPAFQNRERLRVQQQPAKFDPNVNHLRQRRQGRIAVPVAGSAMTPMMDKAQEDFLRDLRAVGWAGMAQRAKKKSRRNPESEE